MPINNHFKCQSTKCSNHRVAAWIKKKKDLFVCCLKEIHFRTEDTQRLKVSKWKKIFHANENDRNAYIKVDLLTTLITKKRK